MVRLVALGMIFGLMRVFVVDAGEPPVGSQTPAPDAAAAAEERAARPPLAAVLDWSRQSIAAMEKNVRDYTATMIKRERHKGKLSEPHKLMVKIRHQPFSAYVHIVAPEGRKGEEAIYVEGRNEGRLMGHTTGLTGRVLGTVSLKPDSSMAMDGQHYPITQIGIMNLTRRLARVAENEMNDNGCEVKFFSRAKINDRTCTVVQITHLKPNRMYRMYIMRFFIDDELNMPIRFEGYEWPKRQSEAPELFEEYTWTDIKLNAGLTDADFDPKNPAYSFP